MKKSFIYNFSYKIFLMSNVTYFNNIDIDSFINRKGICYEG